MRFCGRSCLLTACMGIITHASESNILEVDLVFPRNETYAQMEFFPIVFAFQNAERARYLNPSMSYSVWDVNNETTSRNYINELKWVNWTSQEPYLEYRYLSFLKNEGQWRIRWTVYWASCDEEGFENHSMRSGMNYNSSTWSTWFTIDNSAPKVDLVNATANSTCPDEWGLTFNVTDKTMQVPWWVDWSGGDYTNDTCVVVESSVPTSTPNPCRVHIDKTTVASMEASLHDTLCRGLNPPDDCPKDDKNTAQRLAVSAVSCILAAVGALGFFLV